ELIVSLNAALNASSDVALGNVIGSNIANIGLILGISAIITPVVVEWRLVRREIVVVIAVSLLAFALASDGEIGRLDGVILSAGFFAYTITVYRGGQRDRREIEPELLQYETEQRLIEPRGDTRIEIVKVIAGLALLIVGANFLVNGAVSIAREIGVSDLIIGLTVVAVGTSLPELATCVIAARRGEHNIIVGSVVGSNISNLMVILGIVALVQPIPVALKSVQIDLPVMLAFALVLLPLALRGTIRRVFGAALVVGYAVFVVFSFAA
ncbi:MAG: calcium/sodium antiporter, partial [Chloroflexota bacterium]|nr:calcium/sodium antiporter [Chloroflexota bacterium]